MKYSIPYGNREISFEANPANVVFSGEVSNIASVANFEDELLKSLDSPIGTRSLAELAKGKKDILFLVEDITRDTPLEKILPIVVNYLNKAGVPDSAVKFMTAPGTHRVMTEQELHKKLGEEVMRRFKVYQHDASNADEIVDLGEIKVCGSNLPVHINRRALAADLLVGVGNIVPHSDAGFSGGAKIVQPGVCDFITTQATHRGAGLCPDIPLGMLEGNPCREGIDAVGRIANLAFIINTVKNYHGEVVGFFCGDFMKAHRAGVEMAKKSFSIPLTEQADIVIASSSPDDIDYWQGIKGLTSAYFAVKKGGAVILAAPCVEGLVHHHPLYAKWLASPAEEITAAIEAASPFDMDSDIISAVVALGSRRVISRAKVFMKSDGLSTEEITSFGYTPVAEIQDALDMLLSQQPGATIGILPQAGISLPIFINKQ